MTVPDSPSVGSASDSVYRLGFSGRVNFDDHFVFNLRAAVGAHDRVALFESVTLVSFTAVLTLNPCTSGLVIYGLTSAVDSEALAILTSPVTGMCGFDSQASSTTTFSYSGTGEWSNELKMLNLGNAAPILHVCADGYPNTMNNRVAFTYAISVSVRVSGRAPFI